MSPLAWMLVGWIVLSVVVTLPLGAILGFVSRPYPEPEWPEGDDWYVPDNWKAADDAPVDPEDYPPIIRALDEWADRNGVQPSVPPHKRPPLNREGTE